jgi:hypothetical protein
MFRPQDMPQQVSKALALPAPVGGLNDLDPLAKMDPTYLLDVINFFPDTSSLVVRPGYKKWATGIPGNSVKTVIGFSKQDGTFERYAATDSGIYNITNPTAAPALASACTNGMWEYTGYSTSAGQYLVMANGTDAAKLYNGATWINFTLVASPINPGEVAGVDPSLLCHVMSHQRRIWFIQKNTMTAWYLPVDAVAGTLEPLYLGSIFRKGGNLVGFARWSSDSGQGIDDRIVFFSSTGEIASYSGTDPSDAANWSLDAVFYVAAPLSRRSMIDYGGDILLLSRRGVIPISTLIAGRALEVIYSGAMSRKISRTLIRLTATTALYPPEICLFPELAWVAVSMFDNTFNGTNAPVQLVMNMLTGAWTKFAYPVRTMRAIGGEFFLGSDNGEVYQVTQLAFQDAVNIDGSGGNPINAYAMCAYSYLDQPEFNKHAKFVRPIFQSDAKPSFIIRVLPDFRTDKWGRDPPPGLAIGSGIWDVSKWDEANWSGNENIYRPWCSANVLGYAFSWQLKVSTSGALGLAAVEWVWENGGYI